MSERHDLVVIGAGPGGYVASLRAAQLGMKVACVDRRAVPGGTCLNVGCIPSKALLDSSEHFAFARDRLAKHGVQVGEVSLDLGAMLARKDKVVKGLTDGVAYLFRKNHIAFVHGAARLGESGTVVVEAEGETRTLEAQHILLATGSEPASLPQLPFNGETVVSSTEALAFEEVPSHLIVVGAGYIGLELGSVWSRLGAQVTVAEFLPRILPLADQEAAEVMRKALTRQGLTFSLGTKVTGGSKKGGKMVVTARRGDEEVTFKGDKVLVAVGRRPHTTGLGLQEAGVAMDERSGRVQVDEGFRTNVAGVYAIGDLIEGPMLAHKAEEEGVAVAERLAGGKTRVNHATIPSVVYTDPELASVGLTEEQVREAGREVNVGRFPFQANGRARCLGEAEGLVKMIADARTDRLLGVHIVGPRASELIAEAVTVMEFSGSAEDVARTCHAHPTLSEAMREAALAVAGRALHA
jgi:dihydrolipoamide dehydrogenase